MDSQQNLAFVSKERTNHRCPTKLHVVGVTNERRASRRARPTPAFHERLVVSGANHDSSSEGILGDDD